MNKPSITIIFQVRNEAFFEVTIRSILSQRFSNFQCVIYSFDTGEDLLSKYKINDPRVVYPNNSVIRDIGKGIHELLLEVQSKYVCVIDTSDQLHSNYLETMFHFMEPNPKWNCGHCGVDCVDIDLRLQKRKLPYAAQKTKVSLFRDNEIIFSSLIFRTSFLRKNKPDYSKRGSCSEYHFLVHFSAMTNIKPINEVLIKHIISPEIDEVAHGLIRLEGDQLRLLQLSSLNCQVDESQGSLHLRLMKTEILNEEELKEGVDWLNHLLELNKTAKIYHSGFLYKLFEDVLSMEIQRSLISSLSSFEMNRTSLIRLHIQNFSYKSYLEIGVYKPELNFDHIDCEVKVGVDPQPLRNDIIGLTSDQYFDQLEENEKFDMIFIDGLHHHDQVIRDINNGLRHLNENGTIICHDMLPSTEIMQEVPRKTMEWTGDCWKAWCHFRMNCSELEMVVVNADYGLGIIRKGHQECYEPVMDVSGLSYEFLIANKQQLLNVIEPTVVFQSLDLKNLIVSAYEC